MRSFRKIFAVVIVAIIIMFVGANVYLIGLQRSDKGRPYRVEVNRLALELESVGLENVNLSMYEYVTHIEKYDEANEKFYSGTSDYLIREIEGILYRFEYSDKNSGNNQIYILAVNVILGIMSGVILAVLLYVHRKILLPFEQLTEVPYELAKGNLTAPLKESKSRFFGRFIWGVDLLRENMEQTKLRELELQKSRKTLLLSLSHDIKTPLSAIKLYAQALSKGLYVQTEKQQEIAGNISAKADEIEGFVSQIISASREDFLELDVKQGEFYLSELLKNISGYYREKLALVKTDFSVEASSDCLLNGDLDRSIEVLQNMMENALKYGDGHHISITISEEEGCKLIAVRNSGCTLSEGELPHIFESFWRGSNAEHCKGSGLGLYICRQLMHKMKGEIFAEIQNEDMIVTAVFCKA